MRSNLLILLTILFAGACKQDEVSPTGGLKITYFFNQPVSAPSYSLYSEALYQSGPPLSTTGTIQSVSPTQVVLVIDDLNPGNYILKLSGNTFSNAVQVTAGKQREYTFR